MGQDKAFLAYDNKPVIQHLADKIAEFCDTIVIVGGKNFEHLETFFSSHSLPCNLKIVYNDHYEKGMFSSVKVGISNLPEKEPFFLQMIDQPFVEPTVYRGLIEFYDPEYFVIQPHSQRDGTMRSGHPILMSYQFGMIVLDYDDEGTLRDVIRQYPKKRKFLLVNNSSIFENLNTRIDYLEKVNRMNNGNTSK